jgi:flagellar biosynthesis protein
MSAPGDGRRIAIALQYDRQGAPRVTAKGRGATAEKIIETAKAHDIPLEDDPVLAEALSKVPLDDEIPVELYRAVATVIGFILRHRGRNPAG